MNSYHYLEYAKNGDRKMVFVTTALNITDADQKAKEAGFEPMRLACSIGLKLVHFKSAERVQLSPEEVVHVPAYKAEDGTEVPEKFHRNLPTFHYKIVQDEYYGHSKLDIVEKNERLLKLLNQGATLLWKTPDGFVEHVKHSVGDLLDFINDRRRLIQDQARTAAAVKA